MVANEPGEPVSSAAGPVRVGAGDHCSLILGGSGYRIFDSKGKESAQGTGPSGDNVHIENFLDCIRSGQKPNQEIEEGQKTTLLCHLANIAYRTGHTIHFDPATRQITGDAEAEKLWSREYRPGWELKG